MRRREFLGRAGAGLATAAALGTAPARGATARRPNVIFAFSDEHRWHSMQHTEMPQLQTPHLQRLAAEGSSLRHCISNYPVCSPYRAMLLSGRWPWQSGVNDNSVPLQPDGKMLGDVFQAAGYATAYIGKWHLGGTRAEPFGFGHSLIWTEDNQHWDVSRYHPKDAEPVQPKGYNATRMTDQALDFISAHRDAPFFLTLSWNPPHAIFTDAPAEKKALYPDGALPLRANTIDRKSDSGSGAFGYAWENFQGYHAHISAIDDEVGRLVAHLEALGIAEDTILIYSADHGSMMGSHGLGGKRQPYEESIRVPFIARWPGQLPAGHTVDALVGTIDLFPTLCGLAGLGVPAHCAGVDCAAWLRGEQGPKRDVQSIMHLRKANASGGENHPAPLFFGLRTERHTYTVRDDGSPWQLFDLHEDPLQQDNRIGKPEHAEAQQRLHTAMHEAFTAAGQAIPR